MAATPRTSPPALLFAWAGAALFAAALLFFLYSYLFRFGHAARSSALLTPLAVDLALFTVFALHHSLFARTSLKRRVTTLLSPTVERSFYVWIASLLFIAVCAAWRPLPGELYRITGIAALGAYAVHVAGIVVTARGSARLDVLDLAGVRGALPASTRRHVPLQTGGVYGFVRHPVYFAWVLMVFGTPHMTMTRLAFAVISTAYLAIAIPLEERGLIDAFGPQYREYQQRVRWRMIPGVY